MFLMFLSDVFEVLTRSFSRKNISPPAELEFFRTKSGEGKHQVGRLKTSSLGVGNFKFGGGKLQVLWLVAHCGLLGSFM